MSNYIHAMPNLNKALSDVEFRTVKSETTKLEYRAYAKEINNFIKEQKTKLIPLIKEAQNFGSKDAKERQTAQDKLLNYQ